MGDNNFAFSGVFDGLGHTVNNIFISTGSYAGLFGATSASAVVRNVGMESGGVNGFGNYVGGLVGWNQGTIANSYYTATVSGFGAYNGGLTGENDGTISYSYNSGAINGNGTSSSYTGGRAGENNNLISYS